MVTVTDLTGLLRGWNESTKCWPTTCQHPGSAEREVVSEGPPSRVCSPGFSPNSSMWFSSLPLCYYNSETPSQIQPVEWLLLQNLRSSSQLVGLHNSEILEGKGLRAPQIQSPHLQCEPDTWLRDRSYIPPSSREIPQLSAPPSFCTIVAEADFEHLETCPRFWAFRELPIKTMYYFNRIFSPQEESRSGIWGSFE